ncbi:MAG: PAS domain S-box protein [Acidobacteria bacterium]|nr:PAS domain S-box protein [Acidobacteriota bacterium]
MNKGSHREIKKRRQPKETLRGAQEYHSVIIENVADAIVINVGTQRVFVNKAFVKLLGLDEKSQVLGTPLEQFIVPEDRQLVSERTLARQQGRSVPGVYEYRIRRRDGEVRTVQTSSVPITYKGEPAALAVLRDVTERKRAEEETRKARHYLTRLIESATDAIISTDKEGNVVLFNNGAEAMLGYAREDVLGQRVTVVYESEERAKEVMRQMRQGGGTVAGFETLLRAKDGTPIPVLISASILFDAQGQEAGTVGFNKDLRERKWAEETLRASEKRAREQLAELELLYDTAPLGLCTMDTDLRYWRCNKRLAEINGIPSADHIGRTLREIVPEIAETMEQVYRHVIESGESAIDVVATGVTAADPAHLRHFSACYYPVKSEAGVVRGVSSIVRDITEAKRAEEALQQVSRQNELILKSAGEGIYGLDLQGNTTFVNPAAARMIGWEAAELMGRPMHAILHHSQPDGTPCPAEECSIYAAFKDGVVRYVDNEVFWRKDGSSFPVEYACTPIWEDGGLGGAVVTFKDITERRKAEQQIIDYQERLQALTLEVALAEERERRRIATGLHDDIGQVLAMAKMKLGELQESELSSEGCRHLEEIRKLIDLTIRASRSLTFELSSPILYTLGLEAALRHLGEQMERQDGIRCHFETDNQPKPLCNEANVVLYRTVRELVRNVEKHAHAHQVKIAVARVGDQIHISVEDDGVGFDASRIGQGVLPSGRFGLFSICEQLKQMGGWLEGESVPGQGTRIVVVAPLQ